VAEPIFSPLSVVFFYSCFRCLLALQLLIRTSREEHGVNSKERREGRGKKSKQHLCIRWTQISQRTVMFWVLESWILHCLSVNVACQRLLFSPFIHALYGQRWNSLPVQWETWNSDSLLQQHLTRVTVSRWNVLDGPLEPWEQSWTRESWHL